jgi:hypothetical protein
VNEVDAPVAGFTSLPSSVPLAAPTPAGAKAIVTLHVLGAGRVLQSVAVIVKGEPGTSATFEMTIA